MTYYRYIFVLVSSKVFTSVTYWKIIYNNLLSTSPTSHLSDSHSLLFSSFWAVDRNFCRDLFREIGPCKIRSRSRILLISLNYAQIKTIDSIHLWPIYFFNNLKKKHLPQIISNQNSGFDISMLPFSIREDLEKIYVFSY